MVVSNTSPLIHLASIDRFELLRTLYRQVLIPPAVWREVVEEGGGRAGEAETEEAVAAGWIEIRALEDERFVRLLKENLDDGEAEAIALAEEIEADLLLIDETQAREWAAQVGLPLTGTIGVLVRAKAEGKLETLRPLLSRLRHTSLWISDRLYKEVLRAVGEDA